MAGPSESAGECTILLRPLAHLRLAILPVCTQYTELLRDLGDYTRRRTQTLQPFLGPGPQPGGAAAALVQGVDCLKAAMV